MKRSEVRRVLMEIHKRVEEREDDNEFTSIPVMYLEEIDAWLEMFDDDENDNATTNK